MAEYNIKKVLPIEGPNSMDLRVKLQFEIGGGERLTLIFERDAASGLRDAFLKATDSLRPK